MSECKIPFFHSGIYKRKINKVILPPNLQTAQQMQCIKGRQREGPSSPPGLRSFSLVAENQELQLATSQLKKWAGKAKFCFLLPFCPVQVLNGLDGGPPALRRAHCSPESTMANASFIQKCAHWHAQIQCLAKYLTSCDPVSWPVKLTVTNKYVTLGKICQHHVKPAWLVAYIC